MGLFLNMADVFNKIDELIKRLTGIPEKVFGKAVILELVEELNLQKQLFEKGYDADGNVIGYYSPVTESLNPDKKAGTHYTLDDTGQFYESLRVFVNNNGDIEILASRSFDDGTDIFKFGNILGLTNESKEILAEAVKEEAQKEIRRAL